MSCQTRDVVRPGFDADILNADKNHSDSQTNFRLALHQPLADHLVVIYEELELRSFPTDCQELHIELESKNHVGSVLWKPHMALAGLQGAGQCTCAVAATYEHICGVCTRATDQCQVELKAGSA